MSVAAARKRRAGIQPQPVGPPGSQPPGFGNAQQPPPQQGSPGGPPGGLTLQQVITVINSRLLTLENAEKERRENPSVGFVGGSEGGETLKEGEVEIPIGEILSEYAERFDFLTQELADIKEIVLKLQSYTMDVNRTLLEERLPLSFSSGSDLVVEGGNVQYELSEPVATATTTTDLTAVSSSETTGLTVQTDNLPSPVIQVPPPPAPTGKNSKKSVSIVGV